MWLSQLGKTIQPSDVLFNLTKFSNTLSVGIVSSTKVNASTLESLRNNKQTDRAYANNVVKGSLLSNPSLIGTSTAWEPNAWDGKDSEFVEFDKAHDKTQETLKVCC